MNVEFDPFVSRWSAAWIDPEHVRRIVAAGFRKGTLFGVPFLEVTREPDGPLELCRASNGSESECRVWVQLRGAAWTVVAVAVAEPAAAFDLAYMGGQHGVMRFGRNQPMLRAVARVGACYLLRHSLLRGDPSSGSRWEAVLEAGPFTTLAWYGHVLVPGEDVDRRERRRLYQARDASRGRLPGALCLSPAGPAATGSSRHSDRVTVVDPVVDRRGYRIRPRDPGAQQQSFQRLLEEIPDH